METLLYRGNPSVFTLFYDFKCKIQVISVRYFGSTSMRLSFTMIPLSLLYTVQLRPG